jgi:amidase
VKEDTDVAGATTTIGTAGHGPPRDADAVVIARLREAGAVVIGKNVRPRDECLAVDVIEDMGTTKNPWDLDRTPGGSSGGSAAAAVSGLCGVAFGSDGGGSVRYPAAISGVFGLEPQRGRIPLDAAGGSVGWHGLVGSDCPPRRRRCAAARRH